MPRKGKSKKGKGGKRKNKYEFKTVKPKQKKGNKGGNGRRKKWFKEKKMDKEEKAWLDHWNDFQAMVAKRGCYLKDIDGDGNCLFRAISDQLLNREEQHKKLRKVCVEYMIQHEDTLKFFLDEDDLSFEDYVETMARSGAWAGYFELYCLSLALGVNFTIVRKDLNVINIQHHPQNEVRTLFLAFHEDDENHIYEHYSSIRLLGEKHTNKLALTRQIPFDLFKPILTNNDEIRKAQEQIRGEKDTEVKLGKKMTRKERKKLKKRKKLEEEKKKEMMEMMGSDEGMEEKEGDKFAKVAEIKPELLDAKIEYAMNKALVSRFGDLGLEEVD